MFYCDECRKTRGWPGSIAKSVGTCEICGDIAECHDRPSGSLPLPAVIINPASLAEIAKPTKDEQILMLAATVKSLRKERQVLRTAAKAEIRRLEERLKAEHAISHGRAKLLLAAGDEIEQLQRRLNEAQVRADLTPEDNEDDRTHGLGRV